MTAATRTPTFGQAVDTINHNLTTDFDMTLVGVWKQSPSVYLVLVYSNRAPDAATPWYLVTAFVGDRWPTFNVHDGYGLYDDAMAAFAAAIR